MKKNKRNMTIDLPNKVKKQTKREKDCLKKVQAIFPEAFIMAQEPGNIIILRGISHMDICCQEQCYVFSINTVPICFSEELEKILDVLRAIACCKR